MSATLKVAGVTAGSEKDRQARGLIIMNVALHHLPALEETETALQAWNQLLALYNAKSHLRCAYLLKEINDIKMQPNEQVAKLFARARSLRNRLVKAGGVMSVTQLINIVLTKLPKNFAMIAAILSASDGELDLETVTAKLQCVELLQEAVDTNIAFYANHGGRGGRGGYGGRGGRGNGADNGCWMCGEPGHIKANCPKNKCRNDGKAVALSAYVTNVAY